MSDKITLPWQECEALIKRAFQSCGVANEVALLIARHLVQAEVDGQTGHGLSRLHNYMPQVKSGKINSNAKIKVHDNGPAWLLIDADHGFAYPAIEKAIDLGIKHAQSQGITCVTISHSHHAGVLGLHVEEIAQQGYIGLMMANTPAAMAAWQGQKAIFGTNPIAFACPRENAEPLVIDLSLSKVARGKIMQAHKQGTQIKEGWALDERGAPTTDPEAALQGTLLPAGDAKGAALALMVEIMTAGLAQSAFGFQASSFFKAEGNYPDVAQTLFIMAPANMEAFCEHIEVLLQTMLLEEEVRLPGSNKLDKRQAARDNGLQILKADFDFLSSFS